MEQIDPKGTEDERKLWTECKKHYDIASEDLRQRIKDFDRKDILFRSWINERTWPYSSVVFDPRIFTIITEKNARQFSGKPRLKLYPRENSDSIKANITGEMLNFQWDANERIDEQTMLAKWAMMDLNCRKYGASFGLVSWRFKRSGGSVVYDAPDFKPWPNRDVLHNPSYPVIKNWIQLRDYMTISELKNENTAMRSSPKYKNLDLLQDALKKDTAKSGDTRSRNYIIKNKAIKGLTDYLGLDVSNKVVEIITEYREDRWITFAPNHGVIIRDFSSPYNFKQIPVVQLKYYPIDDDIYGLSEIEPLEKLQLAINAYVNQNLDALNLATYQPLKVRKGGGAVEMHTLLFERGAIWQMNDPATDVIPYSQTSPNLGEFVEVYRLMVSAMQEAAGETSAITSTSLPGSGQKTATEISSTNADRNVRDAFNQAFLAEAMKKQLFFWVKLNQQFLFTQQKQMVIRIMGTEAIQFFKNIGLDGYGVDPNDPTTHQALTDPAMNGALTPQDMQTPLFPVQHKGKTVPKLQMQQGENYGNLIVDKTDLSGDYDFVVDTVSMTQNANQQEIQAKMDFLSEVSGVDPKTGQPTGIAMMLQQEGKRLKASEFITDMAKSLGFKNADYYLEAIPQQPPAPPAGPQMDQNGQPMQNGQQMQQPAQATPADILTQPQGGQPNA